MVKDSRQEEHVRVLAESTSPNKFQSGIKTQIKPIGSSGTQIFGGYFSEEYLQLLRGNRGSKIWDEMRRSEAQVAMLLSAITNPIKSANWEFQEAKEVNDREKHKLLCDIIFKESLDWEAILHEILTFLPFGFSLFETVHSVVFNHPKLGTFNGLQAFAFRAQKTIQAWKLEKQTGKLLSVEQMNYSDVGDSGVIPGEFLNVFSLSKEGDNYEGISLLRPMYGPWFRKNLYLKLAGIGIEKYAVGTPIGTVPAGSEKSEDFTNFKNMLSAYTSSETAYMIKPAGWEIELQKGTFDAAQIKEMIVLENTEMVNSVVANFLVLGMNGNSGAYALGSDLSDFFLSGIQSFANLVCGVFNRKIIPELIKLNFGSQLDYPKLKCTGINDKAGKELSEILTALVGAKVIKPDMKLEEFLRREYQLPQMDVATTREEDPAKSVSVSKQLSEAELKLAEGVTPNGFTESLDKNKAEVKAVMQARLKAIADSLKKKLSKDYRTAKTEGAQIEAPTNLEVSPEEIKAYEDALIEVLAPQAAESLAQAAKEVKAPVRLAESFTWAYQLAVKKGAGFYEALPENIRKIVQTQAALLSQSQIADILKVVTFQFASSNTGTEDIAQIEVEIDGAVDKVLEGSSSSGMSVDAAAGNAVAHIANQARTEMFFDPEVYSEIESFTFENNDPVSEICSELAGTTFNKNDPDFDTYNPPLHHNCKSRMVPNLVGVKGNPQVTKDISVSDKAKKSITL